MAEHRRQNTEHRTQKYSGFCTLKSENGIALVMVLILSAIALAIMAGLIYMITVGTQISGIQKRYKTAQEAGIGGADVTYQMIAARENPFDSTTTSALNFTITALDVGGVNCLTPKLISATSAWPTGCSSTLTINPEDDTTYDMRFDLGASPYPTYRVYSKIVDTVEGNSGGDEGLLKSGVVSSNTGEVTVMSRPYLHTIEVDAQNAANPAERAKYSILYEY